MFLTLSSTNIYVADYDRKSETFFFFGVDRASDNKMLAICYLLTYIYCMVPTGYIIY